MLTLEDRLDRWREYATDDERDAAYVLANAVALDVHGLSNVLQTTLLTDSARARRAVGRLIDRPFVERTDDGYKLSGAYARALADEFEQKHPELSRTVNEELLLAEEREEDDDWFSHARMAFYLARIDPGRSVGEFIKSFVDAGEEVELVDVAGVNRAWLADLALRQSSALQGYERELSFFLGFRAYVDGERDEARQHFDAVLEDAAQKDAYRAIALHLGTTLSRSNRSVPALEESVDLSTALGLSRNEVMARNTLVYALLGRKRLEPTQEMAILNLNRANNLGDQTLVLWCMAAKSAVSWAIASRTETGVALEQTAESVLADLSQVLRLARSLHDVDNEIVAFTRSAEIQAAIGRYEVALETIDAGVGQIHWSADSRQWHRIKRTLRAIVEDRPEFAASVDALRRKHRLR